MILSNRKLKLIIISLLLLIFAYFLGIFKANALTYNVETQMKSQILIGSNYYGTYTWRNTDNSPEIVLDINKTISCDTDVCIASIPLTISYNHYVNTASSDTINFVWDYLGMYGQLWGSSPNYTCAYSGGSLDCPITNGQELKKIEIFVSKVNDSSDHRIQYTRGAFVNVFNVVNVGNTINNIQNNTSDINNSINDSNIDDSSSSTNGFGSTTNNGMNNTPVSNLIALPITFLTGVNNAISSSCTNVNYIELFNYQLVLPCLNLSERLGDVWTIIDTIFCCMLIFNIGKSLVRTFAKLSDMDTNIMYECYANGKSHRGDGD